MSYKQHPAPYLALMPLMLLGSLGGPVLHELLKRMTRRNRAGLESVSRDTWLTLGGTMVMLAVGAGLLYGTESTRSWQGRYPKADTPGRVMRGTAPAGAADLATASMPQSGEIDFAAITADRARAERLSGMPTDQRVSAAIFQVQAAQAGGTRSARLDEKSLSPVSHLLLMGLMFIGGGTGGATGGLRITLACLLLVAVVTGGRPRTVKRAPGQPTSRGRAIALAAAMLTSLFGLVFVVSLVLMYREAGSALACAFEAVSACCNVGLSVGLTPELSVVGRLTLILAMLAGRLIPLMILLRCVLPNPAHALRSMAERELPPARLGPPPISRLPTDDAPIPLE